MKKEESTLFVVRKGDVVGIYRNLSDCQAQVGSSIRDPPIIAYKGNSFSKDTEEKLLSCGLKNALYSVRAADLSEDLFGTLIPCSFQVTSSTCETFTGPLSKKRSQNVLRSEPGEATWFASALNNPLQKQMKFDHHFDQQVLSTGGSCILEFDGASKGNPGHAGAGAVLRADDGSLVCRLREGLGIVTNNFAEYRGLILGLKYALQNGFTSIFVRGDSKLVCMQIQGVWKVKNQNLSGLYEEAIALKDKFVSFQIIHVLRDLNSEADAQANLGVDLAVGLVEVETST